MNENFMPQSRQRDIVVQELSDELLIYDLSRDKAHCLNETSARIWNLCSGNASVAAIARKLSRQTKQSVAEDFVWLAVEQLKKENLLDNSPEMAEPFDGLTRREIIKRAGLASMLALPMVSSLIAPTAAQAASGGLPSGSPVGVQSSAAGGGVTCPANGDPYADQNCQSAYGSLCQSGMATTDTCTTSGVGIIFTCKCV